MANNNFFNPFIKYITKQPRIIISFSDTHAFITDSHILLKLTQNQYKANFIGESTLFPAISPNKTYQRTDKSQKVLEEQEHYTDMSKFFLGVPKYTTQCSNIVIRHSDGDSVVCFTDEGIMAFDRNLVQIAEAICGDFFGFYGTMKPAVFETNSKDEAQQMVVLPLRLSPSYTEELKALGQFVKGE